MIAKTTVTLLLLATAIIAVPTVAATAVGVGDCSKAGACAAVCVGSDDCPGYGNLACAGVSYQMPACVHDPTTYTLDSASAAESRCMGPVCDAVNAVCWIALKTWCVG
jgi:hypothetical protein